MSNRRVREEIERKRLEEIRMRQDAVIAHSKKMERERREAARLKKTARIRQERAVNYFRCMSDMEHTTTRGVVRMASTNRRGGKKKTHISGALKPNPDMHDGVGAIGKYVALKRFRNSRLTCAVKTDKWW